MNLDEIKTANFQVTETWFVECPYCGKEQDAPFNKDNPMQPLKVFCDDSGCTKQFIITYDREEL